MDTATVSTAPIFARARQARDARFDGLFFVAVRSTGIYCRPICPAPTAREANVSYFEHAAAAAAAGFRPCLRCRPELAPGLAPCDAGERSFALAWQRIRDGVLDEHSLAALAAELGLSERQLRRQFVHRVGVAPLAVHTTQRLLLAKQLLTETRLPVTEIAFASGYRSLRRFNQSFLEGCGMPPTRLRQTRTGAAAVGDVLQLTLTYRPPYDFEALLDFLAARAIPGIERVESGRYWRVVGPSDSPGWLSIERAPVANALRLRVQTRRLGQLPDLIRRLRRLFDLDANPAAIGAVLGADPTLSEAIVESPGRRVPGAFDGFETAVRAVLGQQVSVAAARTLCIRLVRGWGAAVTLDDGTNGQLFPTPPVLAAADVQLIGLPRTRATSLRRLAQAVCDGTLDLEHLQPLEEFNRRIGALPGFGPWTAHYIAMRCLHHPDAFPAGDLVLRKQLGNAQPLSTAQVEQRSAVWRPWRAYAVMHLWSMASAAPLSAQVSTAAAPHPANRAGVSATPRSIARRQSP